MAILILRDYIYGYITGLIRLRLRSFRELAIIIITFMCISLYVTTYLFDSSPPLFSKTFINDGQPSTFQQPVRNILSQLSSSAANNAFTSLHVKLNPSFATSGFESVADRGLKKLLKEIEEMTTSKQKTSTKLALIRGQRSVIFRDFAAYRQALEKHKYSIDAPNWLQSKRRTSTQMAQNITNLKEWLILICLTFNNGDDGFCLQQKDIQMLRPFQKVNRIPGLRNLLWKRDTFCTTMSEARKVHLIMKNPVTPLCFVMPNQFQQFVDVAEAMGYSAEWLLKPITIGSHVSGNGPQLINIFTNEGRNKLREYNIKKAVIQQYVANPLLVFGQPVNLRLYVIVTSMAPLRAYVHSEGLVFHRYEYNKNYKKIPGRTWILSQFWQFISKNYGNDKTKRTINRIYRAILQTLLITEAMLITQQQQHSRMHSNSINSETNAFTKCNSCFHLMAFDIVLNATLDPFIIDLNGQPNMQESRKDESPLIGKVKKLVIDDVIGLISATDSVANDVSEALDEVINDNIGVMGTSCHISHDLCLSRDDLNYLLNSRREALSKGSFKNLYPSLGIDNNNELIEELSQLIVAQRVDQTPDEITVHRTADLHSLLMSLERYYYRHIIDEDYGDSAGNTNDHSNHNQITIQNNSVFLSNKSPFDSSVINDCSDEPSTLPYLASIELSPKLQLIPPFSPFITQYHCNVSYEQLLVNVWAKAHNCQSEVRLDDKFGSSRATNYTLGIGVNKISLVVIDISHTEPWVINTYTILINRVPLSHKVPDFAAQLPHRVCSFTQDCDMRVFSRNQCGLTEQSNYPDWRTYLYRQSLTIKCKTGAESGQWLVPCVSCSNSSSCYWHEVRWDPINCHYPTLSQNRLQQCLTNKKILFVGDSTNRGIMHYLIERFNGSLMDWDKTHDLKIYPNMNRKKTVISFAYYPKFWLPTNQRPSFDKAVYQLFEKVQPLENSSNTVLVFGGVQWLATQHIHMLLKTLENLKLQGIKLVMKTLGAGFHQHIEGVHCLTLKEQQKLALHNQELIQYGLKLGLEVVDTYNITIARFKDFMPGKCGCHFHQVSELSSNDINSVQPTYRVDGPINAIYTNILIGRICRDFEDETDY
ncbi:cadherin-like and PC-esterase domain-containing protein 1 [Oppia nitens]|uniref:cadherin-like and PC-esterase domain-containing protein 1 n=1 Tax=Oppia nitens TaxID=1686743 RepID=UPI0023D9BAD1|nr:cadherin-like and PC-esterase domain-containing protein 1 [Oppia nitens]